MYSQTTHCRVAKRKDTYLISNIFIGENLKLDENSYKIFSYISEQPRTMAQLHDFANILGVPNEDLQDFLQFLVEEKIVTSDC